MVPATASSIVSFKVVAFKLMTYHQPVLLQQSIDLLKPQSKQVFIDATLGHGGHSLALLQHQATVFGIEADPINFKIASDRLSKYPSFTPLLGNFAHLHQLWQKHIRTPVDGIIFDLGLSQSQITADNRGFSFNDSQSLDMRLNPNSQSLTASDIVNHYTYQQLVESLTKLSQERFATSISQAIIHQRQHTPITTATQLAQIVSQAYQKHHHTSPHHPATKTFLTLKILVNQEIDHLKTALDQTFLVAKPQATIAIITFHSTEDRLVKLYLQKKALHPSGQVKPSSSEINHNPLARSARLRWYRI